MESTKNQYIYVLKLIERLLKTENWNKREEEIVEKHFKNLEKLLKEKVLVLAGKTEGLNEKTFGIVIIETYNKEEAESIMKNDPAVKEGIMTAELYPYKIALMRKC